MLSLFSSPLGFASMPHKDEAHEDDVKHNPCTTGADPITHKPPIWTALANTDCEGSGAKVQSGADVTVGMIGTMTALLEPISDTYESQSMCPVNVHWHLGAEHKNVGTFDQHPPAGLVHNTGRRLAEGAAPEAGHWCPAVNATAFNMVDDYEWKYCHGMHVGYTYELHWPHSNMGDCPTKDNPFPEWQYQSHFMDGVLCQANQIFGTEALPDGAAAVAAVFSGATNFTQRAVKLGVHAQVFTLTNDDDHNYPEWDMMTGFNKDLATDVAIYQGSTTGQPNGNKDCRGTGGMVTWQVDRGCHMISAKAMDNLCKQMGMQADDMTSDMYAHNARVTTAAAITTNVAMPAGVDRGRRK